MKTCDHNKYINAATTATANKETILVVLKGIILSFSIFYLFKNQNGIVHPPLLLLTPI